MRRLFSRMVLNSVLGCCKEKPPLRLAPAEKYSVPVPVIISALVSGLSARRVNVARRSVTSSDVQPLSLFGSLKRSCTTGIVVLHMQQCQP